MIRQVSTPQPDIPALLDSWIVHLRAQRKSPETLKSYREGVRQFHAWCLDNGQAPELKRAAVNAWVADILDAGAEPATARSRQLSVRRFSAWLAAEGEIDHDNLLGLSPPKLDTKLVTPFSTSQLQALIAACAGRDFRDRRDEALIRVMLETGARASEMVNMTVAGVSVTAGTVAIERGKGGKGRMVPIGPDACRALDRYLRLRRAHRLAARPDLWLGARNRGFTYQALYSALKVRAERARIDGFHPHRLRHTAAMRWLAAGGSEGGLMAVAGWARREMLDRYTRATAAERAAAEARSLNLGDLGE